VSIHVWKLHFAYNEKAELLKAKERRRYENK